MEARENTYYLKKPALIHTMFDRVTQRYTMRDDEDTYLFIENSKYRIINISNYGAAFQCGVQIFNEGETISNMALSLDNSRIIYVDAVVKHCRKNSDGAFTCGLKFRSMQWQSRQALFTYIFKRVYPDLRQLKEFSIGDITRLYSEAGSLSIVTNADSESTFMKMEKCLEIIKDKPMIASSLINYKNGKILSIGAVLRIYSNTFFGNMLVSTPDAELNSMAKTKVYMGLADCMLNHPHFQYYITYIDSDISWHEEMFKNIDKIISDKYKFIYDRLHRFECNIGDLNTAAGVKSYQCKLLDDPSEFLEYCKNNMNALETSCYDYTQKGFFLDDIKQVYEAIELYINRKLMGVYREGILTAYIVMESYSNGLPLDDLNDRCKIYFTSRYIDIKEFICSVVKDLALFFRSNMKDRFSIWIRPGIYDAGDIGAAGIQYKGELGRVMMSYNGVGDYKKIMLSNPDYITKYYPLTYPQKAIWYTEKIYPGTSIGNIAGTIRIKGNIDYELLEKAINMVLEQNDALRIRIVEDDNQPVQYVSDYSYVKVDLLDFTQKGLENLYIWDEETSKVPFRLLDSDLYYFAMLKISENEGGLYAKLHHTISDAWSMALFGNQVVNYYNALKEKKALTQTKKPSYIEYVLSEEEYKYSDKFEKHRRFWNEKFMSMPEFTILKASGKKSLNTQSNRKTFVISNDLTLKIQEYCKQTKNSVFSVFMSAIYIYLSRISSKEDIVIGTPILNRSDITEKNTIGMFISSIPVRMNVNLETCFKTFIENMSKELRLYFKNQRYPYDLLLKDIRQKHKMADTLYDVVFSYQNARIDVNDTSENYESRWHFNHNQTGSLVIHLNDRDDLGQFILNFDYLASKFNSTEIEILLGHLLNILNDAIENPSKMLYQLEMLSEDEREKLICKFNDTCVNYEAECMIHAQFEEQLREIPHKTAVIFEDNEYTFKQIDEMSNSLAHILREKGVGRGDIVSIISKRSYKIIVAQLAVLKAGGAYMPVDPNYPKDRIEFMLNDAKCKVALVLGAEARCESIIDLADDTLFHRDTGKLVNVNESSDLCYVIYTSGSTGKPKGVQVMHKNICNYAHNNFYNKVIHKMVPVANSIVSTASIGFDIFSNESLLPMLNGMTVIFANENQANIQSELNHLVLKHKAQAIEGTPSKLKALMLDEASNEYLRELKVFIVGGEALDIPFVNMVRKHSEGLIFNVYGPTETTVWSTNAEVTSDDMSIGKPVANTKIYILDRYQNLLPVGVEGELCIAGSGVGKGYLNRPELTEEKFVENPFGEGKMYKTGDLARWREDGNIEFIGRIDNQVKIRGLRIELGEIENTISIFEGVKQVAVIEQKDQSGRQYICAYYTGQEIDISTLKIELGKKLPQYMIPHFFIRLDSFPITPNGKTDRKAFIAPDFSKGQRDGNYKAPETELERALIRILGGVLNVSTIGIEDNFFDIGGDSLKAIEFAAKAKREGVFFTLQNVFEYPTIKELVSYLNNDEKSAVKHSQVHFKKYTCILSKSRMNKVYLWARAQAVNSFADSTFQSAMTAGSCGNSRDFFEKYIDVQGYKLYIHSEGIGKPAVLFDSGYGDSLSVWSEIQSRVSKKVMAVSYDRAGIGNSEASIYPRTSCHMVKEWHNLLRKAGIRGPFILVGHSMGAFNARLFAGMYSGEVKGLILIDPSHEDMEERLNSFLSDEFKQVIMSRFSREGTYEDFVQSCEQVRATRESLSNIPITVITATNHGLDQECENIWMDMQKDIALLSKCGKHIIAYGSTHYIYKEQPELVIDAIMDMIDL